MDCNLSTIFPWYTDCNLQNRNKTSCKASEANCPYALLSPNNALLPFQILSSAAEEGVMTLQIYCFDNLVTPVHTINAFESKISLETIDEEFTSIVYYGETLGITMSCGTYFAKLVTTFGTFCSELFEVIDLTLTPITPSDQCCLIDDTDAPINDHNDICIDTCN